MKKRKPTTMKRCLRTRHGAIVPLVAVSLLAIFGVAALSVDLGNLFRERRNSQTAADAAADAGAIELLRNYESYRGTDGNGSARKAALAIAQAHGYDPSKITINIPPRGGNFRNMDGYIEVIMDATAPRFFSSIFGSSQLKVTARSVAAGTMLSTVASVLVLDPKAKNSLKLKGKTTTLEVAGDVFVNSKNKRAIQVSKKSQLKAENVLVTGGMDRKSRKFIDGEVSTGVAPAEDPWSSLPRPSKGAPMDVEHFKTVVDGKPVYDLPPGTYKSLKFDKDETVRMQPGVFVVDGGGFELKGNSSLTAANVSIFNTGKRGFKVSTKGSVFLSPPAFGTYKNIALFQDFSNKSKVEFSKQTNLDISGIIYAPNAMVKFKKSDMDFDADDEEDSDAAWDLEEEDEIDDEEEFGLPESVEVSAAIVAKRLSIDKNSRVVLKGTGISGFKPFLGTVE